MFRFLTVLVAAAAVALAVLGVAGIQGTGHQSPASVVAFGNGSLAW